MYKVSDDISAEIAKEIFNFRGKIDVDLRDQNISEDN